MGKNQSQNQKHPSLRPQSAGVDNERWNRAYGFEADFPLTHHRFL
jgi:hypothetical protein